MSRDFDPGWTIAVFSFIAIVGERLGIHADGGVEIVGFQHLPTRIMYRASTLDPTEMALLADAAARACLPAE